DRSGEFRKISASDRPVHPGLADAADRRQLRDCFRVRRDIHQVFPRCPGCATPETIELSGGAFLVPPLLASGEERLQVGAVHEDRPAIVDRVEALLEPVPDGVAMDTQELCDLTRVIELRPFDQIDPISPPTRGLLLLRGHGSSTAPASGDAVRNPAIDLALDP